jgi:murein DD-endopeptidase MepM/ murein hydrolase activator NlpD
MTPFLQRTVLILLGTSALCAGAVSADAQLFKPKYPIHTASGPADRLAEPALLQPAILREEPQPELILAASRRGSRGPASTVTVRKGDTLDEIADRLGVTVSELKSANGLRRNTIRPGDVLKNPKAKAPERARARSRSNGRAAEREEAAAAPESYKVNRGDTLFSISKRLGVSIDALREANGLSSRAQLRAGQTLRLPGDSAGADARAADEMARQSSRRNGRATARDEAPADSGDDRSASGRVVNVPGRASSYTVRRGDNLAKIADRLNTTVSALKADNRLKGSSVRPGMVLKGPRTAASKAYVAASGDTVDEVAGRFGVSSRALRAENGLGRSARIRPGQKLRLPPGYRDRGPARPPTSTAYDPRPPRAREPEAEPPRISPPAIGETPRSREIPPALPSQPQPYVPSAPTPRPRRYVSPNATPALPLGTAPPVAPQAAAPVTDAQISALGRGVFVWPVRGDVLSEFGPKAGGQRNDGLNVQVESGAPVRAAAAGDVVYAGDQVPGFGNLVLIKHADGWVTAYGHLSHVDVKMQQRVAQGQQIGQAGSTGGVPEPQLHFEVRYAPSPMERARPVDPRLVLPR